MTYDGFLVRFKELVEIADKNNEGEWRKQDNRFIRFYKFSNINVFGECPLCFVANRNYPPKLFSNLEERLAGDFLKMSKKDWERIVHAADTRLRTNDRVVLERLTEITGVEV